MKIRFFLKNYDSKIMLRLSLTVWTNSYRCFRTNTTSQFIYTKHNRKARKLMFPESVQLLVKLLDIRESDAVRILSGLHHRCTVVSPPEIIRTHNVFVKHGMDKSLLRDIPQMLFLKSTIIDQRISFYKDCGCTAIIPTMISSFHAAVKQSVRDFKENHIIPEDSDVTKNLWNCLDKPPPHVPNVESLSDDNSLAEIHHYLLRYYLRWKFEYTEEQIERIVNYISKLKIQSFTLLRSTVDILLNEFEFPKEKIRRNAYLLSTSPYNTREILEEIQYIGPADIKSMILRYPRLCALQVDSLKEKMRIIKGFDVPEIAMAKYPDIFTLSSESIAKRLEEFKTITELRGHWRHPRMLMLIFYLRGVKKRLKIVEELKVRCVSLHILCAGNVAFQRHITIGTDRTKGKDLFIFLSHELDVHTKDPRLLLAKRHTMWCRIPFLHVQESFSYLREENYTNEDILENIQIIFYRCTQLKVELEKVDSMKLDPSWVMDNSRKLAMCLYNMEKKYHFDDNGVWNCQPNDDEAEKREDDHHSRYFRHASKYYL